MIPPLEYLDRYRNEGTRSYSPHAEYTEADARYRPQSEHATFDLYAVALPREDVNIYTADPTPAVDAEYLPDDKAVFCIHPQILRQQSQDPYLRRALALGTHRPPITVAPSSSTRTLFVQGDLPSHALKVHFPFRVSRYGRKMRDEVVQQAIAVSGELQEGCGDLGGDFAFLREVLGVTQKNLDPDSHRGENWGYLVREMDPFPHVREGRTLVPGFSLYGKDHFDPAKPPLLFDLVGERQPVAFVLENIMFPIIRHWVDGFLAFGFILEPHGQNALLEVGSQGEILRIVHRDLNLGIDMRRRRDVGLREGNLGSYNRMESGEFASIAYDKFMGGHFFDRIISTLIEGDSDLRAEEVRQPCKEEFGTLFPDHAEYLPPTVQYFSEQRDQFGKPLFQDTGAPPDWRP